MEIKNQFLPGRKNQELPFYCKDVKIHIFFQVSLPWLQLWGRTPLRDGAAENLKKTTQNFTYKTTQNNPLTPSTGQPLRLRYKTCLVLLEGLAQRADYIGALHSSDLEVFRPGKESPLESKRSVTPKLQPQHANPPQGLWRSPLSLFTHKHLGQNKSQQKISPSGGCLSVPAQLNATVIKS